MGKNKFSLRYKKTLMNRNGFSLVEMVVVLAITGIIGAISLTTFLASRKQVYVAHLANKLTSDTRKTFIDMISTRSINDACSGAPPKVLALKIPISGIYSGSTPFSNYEIVPYCKDPSTGNLTKASNITIDPSELIGYKRDVSTYVAQYKNNVPSNNNSDLAGINRRFSGTLHLVFSSPYGKFYSYFENNLASDGSFITNNKCGVWKENASSGKAYEPDPADNRTKNCAGSWPLIRRLDNGGGNPANPTSVFLTFDTTLGSAIGKGTRQEVRISANGSADLQVTK